MSSVSLDGFRAIIGVTLFAVVSSLASAQVLSPAKRDSDLQAARTLLAKKTVGATPADPFHPQAFADLLGLAERPVTPSANPEVRNAPRNNRELLEAIAAGLKPSGFFVVSGEPTLVFGQKRVKAGGVLTITFEGTEYTLEVTAVDRTNFTLRLNRDEFTRTIK